MLSRSERDQALDTILNAEVWEIGNTERFASGKEANNKFHMERLQANDPAGYERLVQAEVSLLRPYHLDALWYVPDGAKDKGESIAKVLEIPVIHLKKDLVLSKPGAPRFLYCSSKDQKVAESSERQGGTDDVANEFTSFLGALTLSELARSTVVLSAFFGRGNPFNKARVKPLAVELVTEAYVPNVLRQHDAFYWQHGRQAIGSL